MMSSLFQLTGRVEEKRRWSEGIHQAVEAKEGLKIQVSHYSFGVYILYGFVHVTGDLF